MKASHQVFLLFAIFARKSSSSLPLSGLQPSPGKVFEPTHILVGVCAHVVKFVASLVDLKKLH